MIGLQQPELKKALFLLTSDRNLSVLISPDFTNKTESEQLELYERVPVLKEIGITLDSVKEISRDFYNSSTQNMEEYLASHIEKLLGLQWEDGCWPIVDPAYLKTIRPALSEDIERYAARYGGKRIPTPWTNSLMLLLLTKWIDYAKPRGIVNERQVESIKRAMNNATSWLETAVLTDSDNGLAGWPFLPNVTNKVSSYETSMALIALNYKLGFKMPIKGNITDRTFFGEEYLEDLLNRHLRENSGWKNEEDGKTDTGATSYVILCLMKYCEIYREDRAAGRQIDQRVYDEISIAIGKGIEWLVRNQRDDDGWGSSEKETSDKSYIEKTACALMALAKYEQLFDNQDLKGIRDRGIGFLKSRIRNYNTFPEKYAWPNDYDDKMKAPSIKFSSLVISTMLRCGEPHYDITIRQGIMGLFRIASGEAEAESIPLGEDYIYFNCMLADYLKASQ